MFPRLVSLSLFGAKPALSFHSDGAETLDTGPETSARRFPSRFRTLRSTPPAAPRSGKPTEYMLEVSLPAGAFHCRHLSNTLTHRSRITGIHAAILGPEQRRTLDGAEPLPSLA